MEFRWNGGGFGWFYEGSRTLPRDTTKDVRKRIAVPLGSSNDCLIEAK